jgi:hypothetical protein
MFPTPLLPEIFWRGSANSQGQQIVRDLYLSELMS